MEGHTPEGLVDILTASLAGDSIIGAIMPFCSFWPVNRDDSELGLIYDSYFLQ